MIDHLLDMWRDDGRIKISNEDVERKFLDSLTPAQMEYPEYLLDAKRRAFLVEVARQSST